jgi:TonB family protein
MGTERADDQRSRVHDLRNKAVVSEMGDIYANNRFTVKMTAMSRSVERECRFELLPRLLPLCALALFFLLSVGPANSAPIGSITSPIKVSSKEADDNLQVKTLKPEYPEEAKARSIEGIVRLRIVIDERGRVIDTKVISGNALLVPSAIAVVKRFPYRPFTRGGVRVVVTTDVSVAFELHPLDTYKDWSENREIARLMRRDERMDEAVIVLQKALVEATKLGDLEVADTYGDLADLYSREGRYEEAKKALEERLQTLRRSRVQDETQIANTESGLAEVCIWLKDTDTAEKLLRRAIPVQERYFQHASFKGTKDVYAEKLALSIWLVARIYDLKGSNTEAEALYKRAVSLGEKVLDPDTEAMFMKSYADLLVRTGHSNEAAKLRSDASALQLNLKK